LVADRAHRRVVRALTVGKSDVDMLPITLDDMLAEALREVELRKQVYARQVGAGKMRQERADRNIAVMSAIADQLRKDGANLAGQVRKDGARDRDG
jgi:hypothetical protein